jgi:hypothetical protein
VTKLNCVCRLSQAQLIHTFDRRNSSDSCCISAVSLWKKDNQPANRPTCDFQLSRVFEWGRHEVNLGQFLRWKELPVWFGTLSQKTSVSTLFQRWSEHPENSADAFRPFYHQKILSSDIVLTPFLPWWSGFSVLGEGGPTLRLPLVRFSSSWSSCHCVALTSLFRIDQIIWDPVITSR